MTTVNISLTNDQAKFIDESTKSLGFASRSEFIRALLRLAQSDPDLVSQSQTWPFTPPSTKSKTKIINTLKSTGKYSDSLLDDIKKGLDNSEYFK